MILPTFWQIDLIPEFLGDHQPMHTPFNDSDAHPVESRVEDICPVTGGMHQPRMRDRQGLCQGKIFARRQEPDMRRAHPVKGILPFGSIMRKISSFEHILGMPSCNRLQCRVRR